MTIKELEKMYPPKKYVWIGMKNNHPNWDYEDNDIVDNYKVVENIKTTDITDALFKKGGKIKITYVKQIKLNWRRA